jgi:hypothetical protein
MSGKWAGMWFCFAVLFSGGVAALSQTTTGSVRGTVTDQSGAVIAGADVTVTNNDTSVATHTVSDKSGLYDVEFLVIGNYTLSATAPGFETAFVGPFRIQIDQIVTADAKLEVGKTSTTVNVTADRALLLDAETSTISTSISANTLQNMPMDGLNVQISTLYVPGSINPNSALMGGIQGTERDAYTTHEGAPSDAQPSFNGNRQQSNSYLLDGVDINETLQNAVGYNPSPFSIQEVHVITGNADAEFGNVNGGQVVMVTKGGTNKFHGSIFEFHEGGGFTANTWANNNVGSPKQDFHQNQFGAAVGGPIFKNKLFFFANFEGFRNNSTGEQTYSLPTSAMRGIQGPVGQYDVAATCGAGYGDFSAIANPKGANLYLWNTSNGYNNETLWPNNCVPIDPKNKVIAYLNANPSLMPVPNHALAPGALTVGGNYHGYNSSTTQNNQGDVRVDYNVTSKDTLMAKFSYGDAWDRPTSVAVPAIVPYSDDYPFTNVVLAWTRVISPTMVNNFRAGYTRIDLDASIATDLSGLLGANGNNLLGIGMPTGWSQSGNGYAYMDVSTGEGYDISNFGGEAPIQGTAVDNNFDYNDTLNWEHGKHITKFGFDLLRYEQDYVSTSDTGGTLGYLQYNGNATANWWGNGAIPPIDQNDGYDEGYGFADFLVNNAGLSQVSGVHGLFGQRQWRDAVFVQDDWKILPNLTLNLGLRYSYEQPNYEVNNKMVNVNLAYAKGKPAGTPINSMLEFAGKQDPVSGGPNGRALINAYRLGFMPRFGFSYRASPKLVLHGGYGSTDELESTGSSLRMTQNTQFQPQVYQKSSPGQNSQGLVLSQATAFTATNTGTPAAVYYAWDPNMRPAVISQFSLNLQYQIDNQTTIQAGYVGQTGQHLAVPLWANQYTQDDNCAGLGSTAAIDSCYQTIEPYFALVGNPNSPDNPGSDIVKETVSRGISNYNSLQATLRRQETKGLEFMVNYTLGKSLTNNPGYFGTDGNDADDAYWQNAYNPKQDYGPSSFDARHSITGTAVYQLPFGRGKQLGANWNRAADRVFGGWQIAGNMQLNTGFPLTIHSGGYYDWNSASSSCLNNCAQLLSNDYFTFANHYGPMKIANRGKDAQGVFKWFGTDPSAMPCVKFSTTQTPGTTCAYGRTSADYGTTRVGTERGPAFHNFDMSLSKGFKTIQEQVLKARIDAFNAFNIASYAQPNSYISGSNPESFGQITGTASGPRKIQLSLIYEF